MSHLLTPNYNQLNEWPLQFLRTGYYNRSYGHLHTGNVSGFWWSGTVGVTVNGHSLRTYSGTVYAQGNTWKGDGFALRVKIDPTIFVTKSFITR